MADGTSITNSGATTDTGNRYEVCQRSGFRAKPGTLVKDPYTKMWVLPEFVEPLHPQLFVKSRGDRLSSGAVAPDDTGSETFLAVGEVTADDL